MTKKKKKGNKRSENSTRAQDSVCKLVEVMLIFNTHSKKTKNNGSLSFFFHLNFLANQIQTQTS